MEHWLDMGKIYHCDKLRLTKASQYLLLECSCESSIQYRGSEENNLSIVHSLKPCNMSMLHTMFRLEEFFVRFW